MADAILTRDRLDATVSSIRGDPRSHALRKGLLKVELLPYQLDGIAFAVGAGRALIADDMGLGKTLQGIGTAELLAREAGISRVLVVCPASVKAQWVLEIQRATERTCQIVAGPLRERPALYRTGAFYTIANYEQVLRDFLSIETVPWDLIILDEGQRIKNWQAKTAQVIKSLRSPFALMLTGTPLENRLDELYSVVQFINNRQLGPAFRFFHRHRVVDEKGRVLGYRNLDELRRHLAPILLRRTRAMVLKQLPPRTTEILRIEPSAEQRELHDAHKKTIVSILSERFISEMDLLRLQKALLMCRMAADSTFLLDKDPPGYSTKLTELEALLERLTAEADRKIILFSEWTTMLDLIEPLLSKRKAGFVRLDGSVPQAKRQGLVNSFQHDCRGNRVEPSGGRHCDQRRSPVEPGYPGTEDRPRASHGPATTRPRLPPRHRKHDRGGDAHDAFGEAGPGARRPGSIFRKDRGCADGQHRRAEAKARSTHRAQAARAGG
jgi:SNF2 family DNA or RNA helicase